MSFRSNHNPTVSERIRYLELTEKRLSYRTDLKFDVGCLVTPKELSDVQFRVMAQVYGIQGAHSREISGDYLFRWLLAHTGNTRYDFDPKKPHFQWPEIVGHYFISNGQYAEIGILEKILLTILRSGTPTPISDIFLADRMADAHMKTDWIMHQNMIHGRLQMGIQVSVGNHLESKLRDIMTRPTDDMVGFTKKHSPIVTQFLRHGTAVMVFPHFQTSIAQLKIRKKVLLDAKRTYQSRLIKEQNPQFEFYGRWAMEIMNALDDGIKRRVIEKLPHRMEDLSYDLNTKDGHKIQVIIKKIDKKSVVMIQFFPQGVQRGSHKPIVFAIPLENDFLDIYRDKAGVRAE